METNTEVRENPRIKQLAGQVFGMLTVVRRDSVVSPNRQAKWICVCQCGVTKSILSTSLIQGKSQSCGCRRETGVRAAKTIHGMSDTTEFSIWKGIIKRCTNPATAQYSDYGGRGIFVCDSWRYCFQNFYQDMGARPDGTSIDRIDNDGNYCPNNCRWATRTEQNNNSRSNIKLVIGGETKTLSEWSRVFGLNRTTAYTRYRRGYPAEEIFIGGDFRETRSGRPKIYKNID